MIISVYEKSKMKRLKEKEIVIEEIYHNTNQRNSPKFVRATDGKMNDNIIDKALYEKRYFYNNECIKVENNFDNLIHYTIKSYNDEQEVITCPNCGNKGKVIELIDGCPYCSTNFNLGISNLNITKKQILSQLFAEDFYKTCRIFLIPYLIIAAIVSLVSQSLIVFVFWLILIMFIAPGLILIWLIYLCIKPTQPPKEMSYSNARKEMWKIEKNENTFYNDLYTELMIYFYNDKNNALERDLIDFNIVEYNGITFYGEEKIDVYLTLRKNYFVNKKIKTYDTKYKITMKYNNKDMINNENYKIIQCKSCCSNIDIMSKECKYCGRISNIKNEWILDSMKKI